MGWKYLSGSFGTISQISQTGSVETMQLIDNLHCTRYFYLDWAFTSLQTRSDAQCPSVCFKKFHPKAGFIITEKASTRATQALTPLSLNVKLGLRRKSHKGRAV